MNFQQIDIHAVRAMIDERQPTLVDIRDPASFAEAHIAGARNIVEQEAAAALIAEAPKDHPLVVYCYHGMSSQGAAQFFCSQGFGEVYSMIGGFEDWRVSFPSGGSA